MQALKDVMLGMMVKMMPLFNPTLIYIMIAVGIIGLILAFVNKGGLALIAGRILIAVGLIFVVCEIMGRWLGLQPSINFGDANNYEFILWPFWHLGVIMFVAGAIIAVIGRMKRDKALEA